MFRTLIALASATGLVVTAAAVGATSAPATVRTQALKLVKTVTLDMDGDHRPDTVRLYKVSNSKWKAKVVTAKGRTASKTFTSTIVRDWGYDSPWAGAAHLDGVRGYELRLLVGGGDGVSELVLTWRSGALKAEKAPASPWGMKRWYVGGPDGFGHGYAFFTAGSGVHYVDTYGLTKTSSGRLKGTVIRSKWKSGKWTKVRTTKVNLTQAQFDVQLKDRADWTAS
jgi:hypothetical protein